MWSVIKMNIKEIIKRKKNKVSDVPKVEKRTPDVPKVVCEDLELQVAIGQWLGVLSSVQSFGNSALTVYTQLSAEELIERTGIPIDKFEEIEAKFGFLLKTVGIENTETCTLDQFDKNNFSFNCHFDNRGDDATISLRWGSMIDSGPEFIIDYQNESRTYDYWAEAEEKSAKLKLQHYTIKNPENGNSCYRSFSPYKAHFTLTSDEYSLSIEVARPESIKTSILSGYIFRLENEEQLQQYLLGLTFPLKLDEVYKRICAISTPTIDEYPSFKMKVKRKLDEKKDKITDMISLNRGRLKEFIITKGGIAIKIDSDGNWSYDSSKLIVSQNDQGEVNYSLNSIPSGELSKTPTPFEQYSEASKEVEKVKKLTMTMLNGKENQ